MQAASKLANAYARTAHKWLFVDSNSPSCYCRRSMSRLSADVVCSWLKTISTSGRAVHFTLSRNYPEILGCRQHSPAKSGWTSCPHARTVTDSIQSALSTFNVAFLSDYDHTRGFQLSVFSYLDHAREKYSFSHSKFNVSWSYPWFLTSYF